MYTYDAEEADAVFARSAAAEEADERDATADDDEHDGQPVERHQWTDHPSLTHGCARQHPTHGTRGTRSSPGATR